MIPEPPSAQSRVTPLTGPGRRSAQGRRYFLSNTPQRPAGGTNVTPSTTPGESTTTPQIATPGTLPNLHQTVNRSADMPLGSAA
jgi:hypothetical protein